MSVSMISESVKVAGTIAQTGVPVIQKSLFGMMSIPLSVTIALLPTIHSKYMALDDIDLLAALRKEDCGGLSKMTSSTEACYRKYLTEAVHRTINGPQYSNYVQRFDTCFNNRPELECSWEGWWNKDQIFEAGKNLEFDKQYKAQV